MKTVLFDIGGVMIDYSREKVSEELSYLSDFSAEEISYIFFAQHISIVRKFGKGKVSTNEFLLQIRNILQIPKNIPDESIISAWNSGIGEPKNNTVGFIEGVLGKYKIFTASDNNPLHFEENMRKLPILAKFNGHFLSHQMKMRKESEKEKFFEYILETLDEDPKNILFIDDKPENVAYAKNVGMNAAVFDEDFDEIAETRFFDVPLDIPFPEKNLYVGALIIDKDENILLSRRKKDSHVNKNLLTLFGGMADRGESSKNAIAREIFEEMGIFSTEERFEFLEYFYKEEEILTLPHFHRLTRCEIFVLKLGESEKIIISDNSTKEVVKISSAKDLKNQNLSRIAKLSLEVYLQREREL